MTLRAVGSFKQHNSKVSLADNLHYSCELITRKVMTINNAVVLQKKTMTKRRWYSRGRSRTKYIHYYFNKYTVSALLYIVDLMSNGCSGLAAENWTHNRMGAGLTLIWSTPSDLEQVANLLCVQANSASYPQWDGK